MSDPALEKRLDDVAILVIQPSFMDRGSETRFREITNEVSLREDRLVVDLSRLDFIDSSRLAFLVSLYTAMKGRGARVIFCGLKRSLQETFRITRLDKVLTLADTSFQAVATLTSSAPG